MKSKPTNELIEWCRREAGRYEKKQNDERHPKCWRKSFRFRNHQLTTVAARLEGMGQQLKQMNDVVARWDSSEIDEQDCLGLLCHILKKEELTTNHGLLFRDGVELSVSQADQAARDNGFVYAEQLVKHLEANNG